MSTRLLALSILAAPIAAHAGPDLAVTGMYAERDRLTYDVTLEVSNLGDADITRNFYVDVFANPSVEPPEGAYGDVFTSVSGLAAGASTTVTLELPMSSRGMRLLGVVDTDGYVAEEREDDNRLAGELDAVCLTKHSADVCLAADRMGDLYEALAAVEGPATDAELDEVRAQLAWAVQDSVDALSGLRTRDAAWFSEMKPVLEHGFWKKLYLQDERAILREVEGALTVALLEELHVPGTSLPGDSTSWERAMARLEQGANNGLGGVDQGCLLCLDAHASPPPRTESCERQEALCTEDADVGSAQPLYYAPMGRTSVPWYAHAVDGPFDGVEGAQFWTPDAAGFEAMWTDVLDPLIR